MTQRSQPSMDTSQKLKHVFGCAGPTMHLMPGFRLLQSSYPGRCPECGAEVYDATNTPIGQAYLAFTRSDLGKDPS